MATDDVLCCLHPEISQWLFPVWLVSTALQRLSNPLRAPVNGKGNGNGNIHRLDALRAISH
jgi:hypothetical protein